MANGTTTKAMITGILKDTFSPDDIKATVYQDCPLFGMLAKKDDFPGGVKNVTVQAGQQQGIGSTMSGAIDNISSNNYSKFAVTAAELYGVGRITGQAIRATRNDEAALTEEVENAQTGLLQQVRNEIGFTLFGNGGGARGQIAAISGSTITLANIAQARFFERDQKIVLSSDDGTGGAGVRVGTLIVSKVSRVDGVITFTTGVVATVSAAVVGDFLFRSSTYGAMFGGLPMWVPRTKALAGTTLFGVDRSVDPERLAGLRWTAGATIAETVQDALAFASSEGARTCKDLFMNPIDLSALIKSLDSKMVFDKAIRNASDMAEIGYEGVKVRTPGGTVNVWEESNCPLHEAWALDLSTWMYSTLDEFPGYLKEDDVEILRVASEDSYEWRIGAFGQLICKAPHRNLYIPLPG